MLAAYADHAELVRGLGRPDAEPAKRSWVGAHRWRRIQARG